MAEEGERGGGNSRRGCSSEGGGKREWSGIFKSHLSLKGALEEG